jgi:methylmalonyl-CoA/ethylmalonyl-CoA epimerase
MSRIKRIHHAALVVPDLQVGLSFWRDALGIPLERIETLPEQESEVAFLPLGDAEIELVRPTTQDSGIARFLEKRGAGFHHLCLEVVDLDAMLQHLRDSGVRLINPEPVTAAGGRRAAFIHPESTGGVLVELYEDR